MTILAGSTKIPCGTRVRITSIRSKDPDDQSLIGIEGQITHPFLGLMWPRTKYIAGLWVADEFLGCGHGTRVNLMPGDKFEVVGQKRDEGK